MVLEVVRIKRMGIMDFILKKIINKLIKLGFIKRYCRYWMNNVLIYLGKLKN